jgi:tRNA (guanine-N(7)-)-methyltransferase subunit TRM82
LILTADRDERVRASSFPNTHVVRGYLLGHESFVSTMDAVYSPSMVGVVGNEHRDADARGGGGIGRTVCVTGSGDGTVRLWDCASFGMIGTVPVMTIGRVQMPMAMDGARYDGSHGEDGIEMEEEEEEREDVEADIREDPDEGNDEDDDDDDYDDDDDVDGESSLDGRTVAVPLSVALCPNATRVVVARDGIAAIDVHPIPSSPVPSGTAASSSAPRTTSSFVSLHEKQTLACPSQPLAVRCLTDGSVLALVGGPQILLHYRCDGGGDGTFENASSTSSFCALLRGAIGHEVCDMPTSTLERDKFGEWKLQKTRVLNGQGGHDGEDGSNQGRGGGNRLHWNDTRRREVAKLRLQRRRKRRRERG